MYRCIIWQQIKSAVETNERISGCVLQIPLQFSMLIAAHRTQIVPKSDQINSAVRVEPTRENVSSPSILVQNAASTIISEELGCDVCISSGVVYNF